MQYMTLIGCTLIQGVFVDFFYQFCGFFHLNQKMIRGKMPFSFYFTKIVLLCN